MADTITQTIKIEASISSIQKDLKTLESNFKSSFANISNIANSALGALGVGLSAGALIGFGKEVLNLADTLQNLSDQTGLSVELLSGFKSPLEEVGSSMETFAKGVFNLEKNLGNVDKETDPAAQAIKRLGLNLDDLRNSSPDVFVKKITDALGQIENPVERNTILFNLLGKSAQELGPALAALAGRFDELRAKGLSAADVKTLDDVGDALTRLKNAALVLGAEGVAGLLQFFGAMRTIGTVAVEIDKATDAMARLLNLPKGRVEALSSKDIIAEAEKVPEGLKRSARLARDQLLDAREEFERLNQTFKAKPLAPFKGVSESAKTAKNDTDNFLEGLEKQLAQINAKTIELKLGPQAALAAGLDAQLEAFKESLRSKQLPIPKGLDAFFELLKSKILAANQEYDKLKANIELTKLTTTLEIGAIDTSTAEGAARKKIAEITVEFSEMAKKIDEIGRAAGLSQAQIADKVSLAWKKSLGEIVAVQQEALAKIEPQFKDLQKTLAIEILPPDQQAFARTTQEFEERVKLINEWRDAEIAAGRDVTRVNEEAAQAVVNAWTAASQKQKEQVDETSEFTRRAFERSFDAVADALTDMLENGFKSWTDFGEKIRKTLLKIAGDFLTVQAKSALLGEDFGKKGGQVGGILGDLFGTKKPAATPLPATTAQDVLDTERGQQLTAAAAQAQTAIQSSSSIAEAAIQALGTQATAAIQTEATTAQTSITTTGTTAQTGITTTGTTAQAGIEAVKIAALAAIQAARTVSPLTTTPLTAGQLPQNASPLLAIPITSASDTLDREFGQQLIQATQQSITPIQKTAVNSLEIASNETSSVLTNIQQATTGAISGQQSFAQTSLTTLTNFIMQSLGPLFGSAGGTAGGGASNLLGAGAGLAGGILGNLFGTGGSAAVGHGSAPAGVAGPTMANGGFFSSALGGLLSFFGFHKGGEITADGNEASFKKLVRFHDGGEIKTITNRVLPRLHDGGRMDRIGAIDKALKPNERLFVGEIGEFMMSKEAVRDIGVEKLDEANKQRKLPRFHTGGELQQVTLATLPRLHFGGEVSALPNLSSINMAAPNYELMSGPGVNPGVMNNISARRGGQSSLTVNFNVHGVTNPDDFRRSRAQMMSDLTRTVRKAQKYG